MKISEALTACGSDKCTVHSYGHFYDSIFALHSIKSVLEIGIYKGASLKALSMVDETIYALGVDKQFVPGFTQVTATAPDFSPVVKYCDENSRFFDLIIDDGSHLKRDQLQGILALYRFLKPGGIYVIEDIQKESTATEFKIHGARILDLRAVKGRRDDVIAYWVK